MSRAMKWHEFESHVAKIMFEQPGTVNTTKLTDRLVLVDKIKLNELNPKTSEQISTPQNRGV
jgi:hypothetical protein